VRRWWNAAALLVLNTLALFVVLNVLAWIGLRLWFGWRDSAYGHVAERVGLARSMSAYPGWDQTALKRFLREHTRVVGALWDYDPATGFRVPATRGEFVNVTAPGYRTNGKVQPWPPRADHFNVFVFGGSTTFGYGLPDAQTIPAQLQEAMKLRGGRPVQVYNFGVPTFHSLPERQRFEDLLIRGVKPDVAVFIDGLNEFWWDESPMASQLRHGLHQVTRPSIVRRAIFLGRALPLADVIRRSVVEPERQSRPPSPPDCGARLARWSANRQLIESAAAANNVRTLFVWQPIPTYRYDLRHHTFATLTKGVAHVGKCYEETAPALRARTGVVWLGDMQAGRRENLYVDSAHYDAKFSADIARAIAPHVR
jgi:hypothetical protein